MEYILGVYATFRRLKHRTYIYKLLMVQFAVRKKLAKGSPKLQRHLAATHLSTNHTKCNVLL